MTSPYSQPKDVVGLVIAFVFILTGFVLVGYDRGSLGWLLVIIGIVGEFGAVEHHDLVHLRRGETPHAMWGTGDRYRPKILGGPRLGRETNSPTIPSGRQWVIRGPIVGLLYGVLQFATTHSVVRSVISGIGFGILFPLMLVGIQKRRNRRE